MDNKYASCPDWRRSPHADRRHRKLLTTLVVNDHAAACFSQHTRFSTVGQVCHTGLTSVERVIDFSIFDLGGLPLGQRSPKGEMTYCPPRSAILQNFSPIAQTVFEICVAEVIQSFALIFDPSRSSKVKCDGANRKPVGPTTKCSRGPTSYLSPFSRYFESKF